LRRIIFLSNQIEDFQLAKRVKKKIPNRLKPLFNHTEMSWQLHFQVFYIKLHCNIIVIILFYLTNPNWELWPLILYVLSVWW